MSCQVAMLGAALSAMVACPAMPSPRNWVVADRVPVARAAPGRTVFADFMSLPVQNSRGEWAHVRAIKIAATTEVTLAAANTAVSGIDIRSIWQEIYLTDIGGHEYLSSIDGRTVLFDSFLRNGLYRTAVPYIDGSNGELTTNQGAGAVSVDSSLILDLVSRGPGASPLEGLITVAALQARGAQAFRFRCASSFATSPVGVTVNGFEDPEGTAGLWIMADIIYLPEPVIDAPWSLREYTLTEQSGSFHSPEARHEYLAMTPFSEDISNDDPCADVEGISLMVAGFSDLAGATNIEALYRQLSFEESEPQSARCLDQLEELYFQVGVPASAIHPYLLLLPPRPRESAPAGPVSYKYTTRPQTSSRYTHRFTFCDDGARITKIKAAITKAPCGVQQIVGGATESGIVDSTLPKVLVTKTLQQ
jgi:hypothetical protein